MNKTMGEYRRAMKPKDPQFCCSDFEEKFNQGCIYRPSEVYELDDDDEQPAQEYMINIWYDNTDPDNDEEEEEEVLEGISLKFCPWCGKSLMTLTLE